MFVCLGFMMLRMETDNPNRSRESARRPRIGSRGMTLVEILVAVSILSIAMVVIASLFPVAVNYQKRATFIQIASLEARGMLDGAMTNNYGSLNVGTTVSSVPELPSGNTMTVTISPYPTSDSTYLKLVTVRVSWPGSKLARYLGGMVVYHTLIAKPSKEGNEVYADI